TVERAKPVPDTKYVMDLVPLYVIPDPSGPRLSKVFGELLFQLGLPKGSSFETHLLAEFGRVAWPEYSEIDLHRARLLADWMIRRMAPAWLRWDDRRTAASRLESLPMIWADGGEEQAQSALSAI